MSIILNLDTAVQSASLCIAENGNSIGLKTNASQKDQAGWIHQALAELIESLGLNLNKLDAIAVSAGPGSYTGLRVGMATAKGLCYALKKPLITINTLKMMANAALPASTQLLCPMIDARRMEVFTAVYDHQLREVIPYSNLILQQDTFMDLLENQTISFFGNGSPKFDAIVSHSNAFFVRIEASALNMAGLSHTSFVRGNFTELAYSQPFYGKDFHSPVKQSL